MVLFLFTALLIAFCSANKESSNVDCNIVTADEVSAIFSSVAQGTPIEIELEEVDVSNKLETTISGQITRPNDGTAVYDEAGIVTATYLNEDENAVYFVRNDDGSYCKTVTSTIYAEEENEYEGGDRRNLVGVQINDQIDESALKKVLDDRRRLEGEAYYTIKIYYTQNALKALQDQYKTKQMQQVVEQAVVEMNAAYVNSGVKIKAQLVANVELLGSPDGRVWESESNQQGSTLSRFMQYLGDNEDKIEGDVSMLISGPGVPYCGVAFTVPGSKYSFRRYKTMASVTQLKCMWGPGHHTLAHEVGHLMGLSHTAGHSSCSRGKTSCGLIMECGVSRTIMTYSSKSHCPSNCKEECTGGERRINYFSNPAVSYRGTPTGIVGFANAAATLNLHSNYFNKVFIDGKENGPGVVPAPVTPAPVTQGTCPWLLNTKLAGVLECIDGTLCLGWRCCMDHGGRAKCPPNYPTMCNKKTCGGGDYCCSSDNCASNGGVRECKNTVPACTTDAYTKTGISCKCGNGETCADFNFCYDNTCNSAAKATSSPTTGSPTTSPISSPTPSPVTPSPTSSPVTPPTSSPVTPSPTGSPVTLAPVTPGTCPWLLNTRLPGVLECIDGTLCFGWRCCMKHGGRAKCPPNYPTMCNKKTCGGGDYCCSSDKCASSGGVRECKNPATSTQAPEFNCLTKEVWTEEKKVWCCANKKLGCPWKVITKAYLSGRTIGRRMTSLSSAKTNCAKKVTCMGVVERIRSGRSYNYYYLKRTGSRVYQGDRFRAYKIHLKN